RSFPPRLSSDLFLVAFIPCPEIHQEHRPLAPRACEPLFHQRPRRSPRPPQRRPRKRYPPRATRRHSLNLHFRFWIFLADPPIVRPNAPPGPPGGMLYS